MKRPPKVHAARFLRRHKGIVLATADDTRVTCLRCMWWMRRYIPLSRLKQHQSFVKFITRRARDLG